jgi:hypothetical protein
MGSRKESKKRNEDTVPCACGCGTLIFQFGTDGRPRRYARGHQFKNNTYGQKPYSLERILEQVEPLRPFCQCGCGEKLAIPEFLQQMDDGSLSLSPQGSPQIQFHTEGYSSAENHLIAEWLTSLGYSAKVRFYTRGHSGHRYDYVAMGAKAARNLLANLRPFAIPSMDYKFGDGRICEPRWD